MLGLQPSSTMSKLKCSRCFVTIKKSSNIYAAEGPPVVERSLIALHSGSKPAKKTPRWYHMGLQAMCSAVWWDLPSLQSRTVHTPSRRRLHPPHASELMAPSTSRLCSFLWQKCLQFLCFNYNLIHWKAKQNISMSQYFHKKRWKLPVK